MSNKYFRQPIGTDAEQLAGVVWCGSWFDATGYARKYRIGSPDEAYHTGADLNLNFPKFDADRLTPVYSIGDGVVIHAGEYPVWKNIMVVQYELEDSRVVYARYAHLADMQYRAGAAVFKGGMIARVGNANGTMAFHLHFDVSLTGVLKNKPADWPKLNLARLKIDYADPKVFLQTYATPRTDVSTKLVEVTALLGVNVRTAPNIRASIGGKFAKGQVVTVENNPPVAADGYHWQRLHGTYEDIVESTDHWIAVDFTKDVPF